MSGNEGGYLVPETMDRWEKRKGLRGWVFGCMYCFWGDLAGFAKLRKHQAYQKGWEYKGTYNVLDELLKIRDKPLENFESEPE